MDNLIKIVIGIIVVLAIVENIPHRSTLDSGRITYFVECTGVLLGRDCRTWIETHDYMGSKRYVKSRIGTADAHPDPDVRACMRSGYNFKKCRAGNIIPYSEGN